MRVVEDPLNRDTIQAITQLIVERFEPEQIILFGSYARGEEDENSDLDLLVVLRPGQEPPRPGKPTRRAIADHFELPVDLLMLIPRNVPQAPPDPQLHPQPKAGILGNPLRTTLCLTKAAAHKPTKT